MEEKEDQTGNSEQRMNIKGKRGTGTLLLLGGTDTFRVGECNLTPYTSNAFSTTLFVCCRCRHITGQARKRTPTPNASNEIDGVFDREWVGDWMRLMYSLSLKVASSASELPSAHKHTHKLTNTHCWSASSQHSTSSASACVCALPNSESLAIHLIGEAQFLIKLIKLTRWKWREEERRKI